MALNAPPIQAGKKPVETQSQAFVNSQYAATEPKNYHPTQFECLSQKNLAHFSVKASPFSRLQALERVLLQESETSIILSELSAVLDMNLTQLTEVNQFKIITHSFEWLSQVHRTSVQSEYGDRLQWLATRLMHVFLSDNCVVEKQNPDDLACLSLAFSYCSEHALLIPDRWYQKSLYLKFLSAVKYAVPTSWNASSLINVLRALSELSKDVALKPDVPEFQVIMNLLNRCLKFIALIEQDALMSMHLVRCIDEFIQQGSLERHRPVVCKLLEPVLKMSSEALRSFLDAKYYLLLVKTEHIHRNSDLDHPDSLPDLAEAEFESQFAESSFVLSESQEQVSESKIEDPLKMQEIFQINALSSLFFLFLKEQNIVRLNDFFSKLDLPLRKKILEEPIVEDDMATPPLFYAASRGLVESFSWLLDQQDISIVVKNDGKNLDVAMEAAINGQYIILKKLAEKKPQYDWNYSNSLGYRAIHYAAHYGHLEAFKILLNLGADIRAITNKGFTVVMLLIQGDHFATGHKLPFCANSRSNYLGILNAINTSRFAHEFNWGHCNEQKISALHLAIIGGNSVLFAWFMQNIMTRMKAVQVHRSFKNIRSMIRDVVLDKTKKSQMLALTENWYQQMKSKKN